MPNKIYNIILDERRSIRKKNVQGNKNDTPKRMLNTHNTADHILYTLIAEQHKIPVLINSNNTKFFLYRYFTSKYNFSFCYILYYILSFVTTV